MSSIVIYSPRKSPRLVYVLDWLLKETLQLDYVVTTNENEVADLRCFISYGKRFSNALSIPDANLLWDNKTAPQNIGIGNWEELPVIFPETEEHTVPFDFFSAVFFLISRYEEYGEYTPDKHGRYPAAQSILAKSCLLERPIVDEWIFKFYSLLNRNGFQPRLEPFGYIPTYDIDIAYSYKHKGIKRAAGAFLRDILKGNLTSCKNRLDVLLDKVPDPYDCFSWLQDQHREFGLAPYYFILCSLRTTSFDKNIHPYRQQMSELIRSLAAEGVIGLHPSYYSATGKILSEEKTALEHITGYEIRQSRQHYIRLNLPETYKRLLNCGITTDWSMGYGSKLGFRAGTGRSFLWYDLQKEQQTSLRILPFCFMDSTARFEEGLTTEAAFSKLSFMKDKLKHTSSQLITVFHNFSLGNDAVWSGWHNAYHDFLKSI